MYQRARLAAAALGRLADVQVTIDIPSWARHLVSDHTDMDRSPHPVDSTKVSRFTLELPDDVYFEYGFLDEEGRLRPDPANDRRAENPWYPEASAVSGPEYAPDPYAEVAGDRATGDLRRMRWESERLSEVRRVNVYTPEGHGGPLPTILVQDGTAYMRVANLPAVLEALVRAGAAAPARLVLVEPVDRQREYGFDEAYRSFVLEEVLPRVEQAYGEPTALHLMGASLGGLFSMTLALLHPDLVDGLATQSGAFLGTPEEPAFYRHDRSWVAERLAEGDPLQLPAYTEVGTIEWLTAINREVHGHLEQSPARHVHAERNAGHNWVNWRNGLAGALSFLLPPR